MIDRFKDFDLLDKEILLRALRNVEETGLRSVEERTKIMMDELNPKETYSVVLRGYPEGRKIAVIKLIRSLTPGLALLEAKEMVETLPATIKSDLLAIEADNTATIIRASGATVEVV